MAKIESPDPNSPYRFKQCKEALEDRIHELLAEAQVAGWERNEALAAITEVVDDLAIMLADNDALRASASQWQRDRPA